MSSLRTASYFRSFKFREFREFVSNPIQINFDTAVPFSAKSRNHLCVPPPPPIRVHLALRPFGKLTFYLEAILSPFTPQNEHRIGSSKFSFQIGQLPDWIAKLPLQIGFSLVPVVYNLSVPFKLSLSLSFSLSISLHFFPLFSLLFSIIDVHTYKFTCVSRKARFDR